MYLRYREWGDKSRREEREGEREREKHIYCRPKPISAFWRHFRHALKHTHTNTAQHVHLRRSLYIYGIYYTIHIWYIWYLYSLVYAKNEKTVRWCTVMGGVWGGGGGGAWSTTNKYVYKYKYNNEYIVNDSLCDSFG